MNFLEWNYSYYIIIGLQLLCILHALRIDKRDWLYLLIFLPLIGSIIYIIRELIPRLRGGGLSDEGGQRSFFASGRIKDLERKLRIADTDANRLALAAEYARQGQYGKAMELTQACLTGMYAQNPGMMLDMGRYAFGAKKYAESLAWLDQALARKSNRFDKPEDELIYARALEQAGEAARAEAAYQQIIRIHHSMEARYHYGNMLKAGGRAEESRQQYRAILDDRDLHPPHVRRLNAKWVAAARRALVGL